MADQCDSVLALDRLGTGASSRPAGDFITKVTEADAIAQVLSSLRTNHNPAGHRTQQFLFRHQFLAHLSFQSLPVLDQQQRRWVGQSLEPGELVAQPVDPVK
ncbi:MAG: hypothetical protein R3E79_11310 [Caldilineaceae bacterium]